MPELPEVQTVVDSLRPRVLGQHVRSLFLHRTDIVSPADCNLPDKVLDHRVKDLFRRGKRIVFELDDHNRFFIHLGMTGRLTIESTPEPRRKHTHLVLGLSDRERYLHFTDPRRFGGIWWLGADEPAGTMGPEPLTVRPQQLAKQLARTRRVIKVALLDQTVIAGVGNIYADEALFLAGLHPLRPADSLTFAEVQRLTRGIKLTLRRALRHRGSSLRDYVDADGNQGAFQKMHNVYDRAKKPCRKCKTPIERLVITARSSHFCPNCQPAK